MPTEVFMPKMSDHMEAGVIVGWLVTEGERVTAGQPIVEVETDKTVAEIEAPATGFIKGIRSGAAKGSAVPVGETMAFIVASPDEAVPGLQQPDRPSAPEAERQVTVSTASVPPASPAGGGPVRSTPFVRKRAADLGIDLTRINGTGPEGRITEADLDAFVSRQAAQKLAAAGTGADDSSTRATPFVRKRARELGVDLAQVPGSGPHGRISEDDLNAFLQRQAASKTETPSPAPAAPAPAPSTGQWLELTKIQRVTGERMTVSAQTVPQFNLTIEVDATNLLALRDLLSRRGSGKISITAILVAIAANVLRRLPRANASFVEGRLSLHDHVNIGVAVGSEDGLLVPVVHDADQRSLVDINTLLAGFREKAARRRFAADDLIGGTFTLSNLGMFGIRQFTAIVNPPESGILAVGEIVHKPVCLEDKTVAVRPVLSLTLTVDHRSLDGIVAAQVLAAIKDGVEQPMVLILDRLEG